MDFNQEMTKILAKVMHSSYKRKEVNNIIERILSKMEKIITSEDNNVDLDEIKKEYNILLLDINKYLE